MPVADAPDFRSSSGLSVAGEVEIDAFSNQARLVPSAATIQTFKGATGLQGETGEQGPQGDPGLPGPQGPQGVQGLQGLAGLPGADGRDGTDGSDGLQGQAGAQGPQGIQGIQGFPGDNGSDGQDGSQGLPGAQGPVGDTGPAGPSGPTGANGADGTDGNDGLPGPVGPIGPIGLTGPTGPAGDTGPRGSDGDPGADGNDGMPGPVGPIGPTGSQGQAGLPFLFVGADGVDGVDGSWGLPGIQGPSGSAGNDGSPGSPGLPGQDGADGQDGAFCAPGWASALASNPRSGGNNAFIDAGQFVNFGVDGPTASNPQIRSGDTLFRVRGTNGVSVGAGTSVSVFTTSGDAALSADAGNARADGFTSVIITTGALIPRLVISSSGEWTTPTGGASGNVLTHNGAGAPPTWQTPTGSTLPSAIGLLPLAVDNDDVAIEMPFMNPPGWAAALASNPRSGGNNAFMDVGQFINFGLSSAAAGAQLRSADALFRMRGDNQVQIIGDTSLLLSGAAGATSATLTASYTVATGSVNRLVIASTGEWTTPSGGASGNVLTHQGAGNPPVWAAPTGGGGGGSGVLATTTVNLGSTLTMSGNFQITGLSGLTLNDPVPVFLAVSTTDPTEAEEQISISGIATSTSVVTCYWQSVDGTPKSGNKLVSYLVASGVTASGPSTLANEQSVTWASQQNNFARSSSAINVLRVTLTGDQTLTGITGGVLGSVLVIENVDSGAEILTIASLSASSAAANEIVTPGGLDLKIGFRESAILRYTSEFGGTWRVLTPGHHIASEGQMMGLPITHAGPGTNGAAVPIDGSVVGENIRYATNFADALISGSVLSYQIAEPITSLVIDAPSFFKWRSVSLTGVGNGTAIAATGRQVIVQLAGSSAPVLLIHEDTGESTQQRRFLCPGSKNYLIRPKETVILHRDIVNSAASERVRVMPFAPYVPALFERQDFDMTTVGITNTTSSTVLNGTVHNYWQSISNTAVAGHGSIAALGVAVTGHKGIMRITTGATGGDIMSLYLTGAPGSGQNAASASIDMTDFVRADYWIKLGGVADSRIVIIGLGVDALSSSFGTDSVYFQYNPATTGANWATVTRAASVSTTNSTAVAANSTAWVKFSIERVFSSTTSGFLFYINDDPLFFHTTNLPSAVMNAAMYLNTQSAAAKSIDVDRVDLYVTDDHLIG